MLKIDEKHKEFQGKVLCSKGIGAGYSKSINARNNKFKGSDTNETYRLPNGAQQVIRKLTERSGNNKGMQSWKEISEEILKTD